MFFRYKKYNLRLNQYPEPVRILNLRTGIIVADYTAYKLLVQFKNIVKNIVKKILL